MVGAELSCSWPLATYQTAPPRKKRWDIPGTARTWIWLLEGLVWARLSDFAGVRRAEGVRGFQGTYDTINQAGHLLPPFIMGGQQQAPLSGNTVQHGPPPWYSVGNKHPISLGAGKGRDWGQGGEGQQGKGMWPGSRRT